MTVSGVSLWLSFKRRLKKGFSLIKIWAYGFRRYGMYILLSFLICIWVADVTLFLEVGEVIGAIGSYAMISLTLLLIF